MASFLTVAALFRPFDKLRVSGAAHGKRSNSLLAAGLPREFPKLGLGSGAHSGWGAKCKRHWLVGTVRLSFRRRCQNLADISAAPVDKIADPDAQAHDLHRPGQIRVQLRDRV